MSDNTPISFRFIGIQIVSKYLAPMPEQFNPATLYGFGITIETKINTDFKLVMPFVYVKIFSGEPQIELANLTIACQFEIIDFDTYIVLNEVGQFVVPGNLDAIIRPVAISTARGVLYSELKGTYLNGAIMPVIFMDQFKDGKVDDLLKDMTTNQ
jgi:hypothetical protein